MQLAKNVIDVGLSTNNLEPMLRFWLHDVGLRFDHVLPVGRGQKQYRHDALGSLIKLNHHIESLPAAAPSGYRELSIARASVGTPCAMVDPDGNRIRLVATGHDGITQLAITMGVRSISEHRRFYGGILGFTEQARSGGAAFRLGDSLLLLEEDHAATAKHSAGAISPCRSSISTPSIIICETRACAKVLRRQHLEDGNWIELSRRASIAGSLT
jgi:catechol 2,3-dioxygenase-like lactoylglutathione lyase family enzyme